MHDVLSYYFVTDHSLWGIQRNYRWLDMPPWILIWHSLTGKAADDDCGYFETPEAAIEAIVAQKTGFFHWDHLPKQEIPEGIADLENWNQIPGELKL